MQLINISESNSKEEIKIEDAIGIDLGTTNSLVAFSEKQKPYILHENASDIKLKSIVSFKGDKIIVGQETDGVNLYSTKRLMGKTASDIGENIVKYNYDLEQDDKIIKFKINEKKSVTPIEVSAEILKELKIKAEKILAKNISKAVITVPAYFDDAARHATIDAAKLAGLEVLRLINEPTAAALAYGLDERTEGYYAIYDFGGGTFDVSILKMTKGVFKVIATKGDNFLGGDDIDIALAENLKKTQPNLDNKQLLELARKEKEKEKIYDKIIEPFIGRTIDIFKSCLIDAELEVEDIKEIVLVGGSTRLPLVKQKIEETFAKKPLDKVNPDTVVALGAAAQAESLTKGSGNLLLDIIPLSLGLETMGGVIEKIIPRNSTIPIEVSQSFTTQKDNQTGIKIHITQGERELAEQNRSLAFFEIKNLPRGLAGSVKVKINYKVDMDGILTVSAIEEKTGKTQEIQVKPSYGLDSNQMHKMLKESMENAKSDMVDRIINKSAFEIEGFCDAILKLVNNEDFQFPKEKKLEANEFCQRHLQEKRDFLKNRDYEAIDKLHKDTKEYLNNLSIEKVNIITDSIKGKTLDEINNLIKES